MSIDEIHERYIELLLTSVDLQAGGKLLIRAEPIHWEFINRVAEAAYRRGARYVHVMANHAALGKARIGNAPEDSLDWLPDFVPQQYREFADGSWSVLALNGPEDPDLFRDVNAVRSGRVSKAQAKAMHEFRDSMQRDRFAWCVAALPTPMWAKKVTGEEDVEALWKIMTPILRLDRDDPPAEWFSHGEKLKARARKLGDRAIESLRFRAGETDLSVGLLPESVWVGGGAEKPDGRAFLPNVPTEEVFTTPHRMKTEGFARASRPVLVLGKLVEGAWFEFSDGAVVNFGAEAGSDILEQYFAIDEHARRLGEIALVDSDSPVFQSKTVFYNILYDENAACHMALGSSYPSCVAGSESWSEESYVAKGGNRSDLHTDFMIGTDTIDVTAKTSDGAEFAVMRDGRFV